MNMPQPFKVKCAGGAAAQILALTNAIYLSSRIKRPFQLDFYPYGTGTYWPFEIRQLLSEVEIGDLECLSRGHRVDKATQLRSGQIVKSHPINEKRLSVEKLYSWLRHLGLSDYLLRTRGEVAVGYKFSRLNSNKFCLSSISGGFVPFVDSDVRDELSTRFEKSNLPNPFLPESGEKNRYPVVVHYRLGDKRAKFTNPGVVGDDGVVDPKCLLRKIEVLGLIDAEILIVSDDPSTAKLLFDEAGVSVQILDVRGSIWSDLKVLANAPFLLGTWSQVSQLAAVCVLQNGGRAVLPISSSSHKRKLSHIPKLDYYKVDFLPEGHWIYY